MVVVLAVGLLTGLLGAPRAGSDFTAVPSAHAADAPPATATAAPAATAPGRPDRTLRIAIDAEPAHVNPLLDPDLWGYRIAHDLLCEPLVRRRPDAPATAPQAAQFEGVLAERFRIDSDERGIELWVRRGVRFHDGKPLTAFDVRVSIDLVRNSPQVAPRTQALLDDVLKVSIIGKDVVRLDLRRPSRRVLSALAEVDVLPASQFPSERLFFQPFNRRPICTGPFRLHEWKRGTAITLRRFPGYWGDAGRTPPAGEEQPDELRFVITPDGARGLAQLRQGQVDLVGRVSPRYLREQVDPAVQRGRWQKLEIDASQAVALVWNARSPVVGAAAVRRALAVLIDKTRLRQRIVREVRAGLGTPVRSPLLGATPGLVTEPGPGPGPGDDAALDVPAESPAQAAQRTKDAVAEVETLLDQAGMPRFSPGGARHVGGRPVRIRLLLPAGSTELVEVAKRLAELAGRVGLKLEPESADLLDVSLRLRRGMFDAALLAWAWTGGPGSADLEPLLRYVYDAKSPIAAELSGALAALRSPLVADPQRAATRLVNLWQGEEPVTLLYRPRQLVVFSPQLALRPARDFVDLRTLVRQKPRSVMSVLAPPAPPAN